MEQCIKKGFCVIILVLLLVPNIGLFFSNSSFENCEKRNLSVLPDFSFSTKWTDKMETFYKDHFTFRNLSIHLNSFIKKEVLRSSSKPKEVCLGKEDWLFYNSAENQMLGSYAHTNLWAEKVLIQKTRAWEIRKEKLATKGIQYHMAVWPNKTTIYPEYLPYRMRKQIRNSISKIDQILQQLRSTNSPIELLDLRALLLERKAQEKLYLQHDSHWNELGAFYAYQALMESMGMASLSLNDYQLSWNETTAGDLKDLLGLCNMDRFRELAPQLSLKSGATTLVKQKTQLKSTAYYTNHSASSDLCILIFKDSYTDIMRTYLGEHFSQLYYVGTDYNEKMVLELKPDIVLVAKVERRL